MPASDSLIQRLLSHAALDPDRDAVVTPGTRLSYSELAENVLAQAQHFESAGVSKSSVVGIGCDDETQHLLSCLAAIQLGATSFAIPAYESQQSQQQLIKRCGATHISDGSTVQALGQTSSDSNFRSKQATDAQLFFSTSGTTGEPKIVIHHDRDLVAQAHRHIDSKQERFACLASMQHNFSKRHRLYCVAVGATNIFLDSPQESLVSQCRSLKVNVLHVSAFQAQELLALPDVDLLSDIRLKLGGSHVPIELRRQLREQVTSKLQAGYGTTETGAIGFTDPDDREAAESVGQALPGIDIRVVSADRTSLADGERGELAIRCDGMFRGYLGRPELTTERLDDDWFYTGDIGYLDNANRIHLCGRADNMFMFNSMNIHPQVIETTICQYPGVVDALVLPKKSAVHDNIPIALVVLADDRNSDLTMLKTFVHEQIGARCPRQFITVEALPRNAAGKVSRTAAVKLSTKSDQIRSAIVATLSSEAVGQLKPSTITAFENGEVDITLRDIDLDSFARMEILVTLEVDYGVVISPEEFGRLASLGNISATALSSLSRDEVQSSTGRPAPSMGRPTIVRQTDAQAYMLRFFQRVFHFCDTVAQLHKALGTLEHRLTPLEVTFLHVQHCNGRLIPSDAAEKFQTALTTWFEKIHRLMSDSGKREPEAFMAHRITSTVSYFAGPGDSTDKTLLVCFANKGSRLLMMPNAVLMQHTDSTRYDLLVVSEPLRQSYRLGVPLLGHSISEVIDTIGSLELVHEYRAVRTLGCSAGAFMAVIAGLKLNAELAVSVAGRFHSERYPLRILDRILTTWRVARKSHHSRVLMSYPADKNKSRDHTYARIIGYLTEGSLLGLEFTDGDVGHLVLQRLVERGELALYLAQTIFAELDGEDTAAKRANLVFTLPAGEIRPPG